MKANEAFFNWSAYLRPISRTLPLLPCVTVFPRLLTESKQAEFIRKARILIQLEKYEDAVSIWKTIIFSF